MTHYASPSFWECFNNLPINIRELADKNYQLLKQNPSHRLYILKKYKHIFQSELEFTIVLLG